MLPDEPSGAPKPAWRPITLCGEQLTEPGHICAFFDSREEKYRTLAPFFADAIAAGDHVINVVDEAHVDTHASLLADAGVPLDAARARGSFQLLTAEQTYLRGGAKGLDSMIGMLAEVLESDRRQGRCTRTCGEMNWVTRTGIAADRVLEYEAKVNGFLPSHACTLMCVYDLAHTPASMVSDLLAMHGHAIVKGRLRPNPYRVNPFEYLDMIRARRRETS